MEDIVWIGNSGQDNSGAFTLGIEFNKVLVLKLYLKVKNFLKVEFQLIEI